jgi:broad specificity phosphatase PhoE
MNGDGEKMRGWLPLPLSNEGKNEIENTASVLDRMKVGNLVSKAYTSDLPRAIETSKIISPVVDDKKFERTNKLRDWNVGDYTGKSVKANLNEIHHYLEEPDKVIPGGESYNQFYDRVAPFVKSLVEDDDTHIAVTHNRILTLIDALAKNKGTSPDLKTLKEKGPVSPGGIVMIDPDWNVVDKIDVNG